MVLQVPLMQLNVENHHSRVIPLKLYVHGDQFKSRL